MLLLPPQLKGGGFSFTAAAADENNRLLPAFV
jgi:hypothetical protein